MNTINEINLISFLQCKRMSFPFQSGQLTLASNRHQFYQSTGKFNSNINFGGEVPSSSTTGIHDTDLDSNTGLHEHWREYNSWNTTGITSNLNLFTPTTTGVTVIKRGYYRCAVTLHFQTDSNNVNVVARWAKNNVIDGPVGISNRVKPFAASSLEAASLSVSWIFFCIPNDTISLYTSRAGAGNQTSAKTREGLSSIIIEYIGDDS